MGAREADSLPYNYMKTAFINPNVKDHFSFFFVFQYLCFL